MQSLCESNHPGTDCGHKALRIERGIPGYWLMFARRESAPADDAATEWITHETYRRYGLVGFDDSSEVADDSGCVDITFGTIRRVSLVFLNRRNSRILRLNVAWRIWLDRSRRKPLY
jgi:hypothetical protein